ncbi:SapC family protein [Gilvimarinus sp. DA14]|uniref:SapC family protein n=1 Tax=Gilvimarinus sp. DA14 TaxID=2956798 RepID=UPI0020B7C089|nr:SapC family protein [Gilvimarinus sp. DA14]UTF60301.1 SapC family protein [Gilvimarinus sp. DA14]
MANHALLNNVNHQNLKVDTRYRAEFGDNQSAVITFPTEFADIQRHYPILLQKNSNTGEFQAVALLGFNDENLFLQNGEWAASYVPGVIARGPFLIGFQEQEIDGEVRKEPVIHVDLDDPRVNETEGEPVFLEHGGNSPYLERVVTILKGIHDGLSYGKAMYAALAELELIEQVNLEIKVHDDEQYNFNNFYTISDEKLAQLDGENLAKLNRAGFLEGAFLLKASLTNIKTLIELKRKKIAAA